MSHVTTKHKGDYQVKQNKHWEKKFFHQERAEKNISSVIRQKSESQNGGKKKTRDVNFPKNKHNP